MKGWMWRSGRQRAGIEDLIENESTQNPGIGTKRLDEGFHAFFPNVSFRLCFHNAKHVIVKYQYSKLL